MSGPRAAALVGALALQAYALFLYAPDDGPTVALPHLDKAAHLVIFALPAVFGLLAGLPAWLVGVVLGVYAPVSELIQHRWLPGRSGDPWDVVADWLGVLLGLAVGGILGRPPSVGPDQPDAISAS